jgi:hypothetical protein
MQKIYIRHPEISRDEETRFTADAVSGSTTLNVENTSGLSANDLILLEKLGQEKAEIVTVTTIVNKTTLTCSSTSFAHSAGTKIYKIDFNQIKIYRSTTGINGTYTLYQTIPISVDQDITEFVDNSGSTTTYYKFSFFNSVTANETDLSDPISSGGFVFHSLGTMVDRVLSLFGDTREEFISFDEVKDWINEFLLEAYSILSVHTKRFNISTTTITLYPTTDTYTLPSDFLVEKAVKLSRDSGSTFPTPVPMQSLDSQGSVFQDNVIYTYLIYNNNLVLDRKPYGSNEILKIWYISQPTSLNSPTDTLSSPFQNHSHLFVRYALALCYLKAKKFDEYNDLKKEAFDGLDRHINFIKKVSNLHPQYSELVSL